MKAMPQINEADALAFHGMAMLAQNSERRLRVKEIAEELKVSFHHLRKVFLRLEKEGLVKATTGPWGGYELAKPSEKISLLQIYEALEGRFKPRKCLLEKRVCQGRDCLLGDFLVKLNLGFKDYLARTKLSEFKGLYSQKKRGKR